jgi:hypothetical protein
MGNDVSKGFSAVGNTIKEGLGAWFDPSKRKMILGQVAKRLPTLHEDLARVSDEQSPALGLVSRVASGLIKTLPATQMAEKVLGNVASGNVGGLIGNAIEAKVAKPTAMSRLDLLKGVANEITSSEKKKTEREAESQDESYSPAQTASVPMPSGQMRRRPAISQPQEQRRMVKPAVIKSSKSKFNQIRSLLRE